MPIENEITRGDINTEHKLKNCHKRKPSHRDVCENHIFPFLNSANSDSATFTPDYQF